MKVKKRPLFHTSQTERMHDRAIVRETNRNVSDFSAHNASLLRIRVESDYKVFKAEKKKLPIKASEGF